MASSPSSGSRGSGLRRAACGAALVGAILVRLLILLASPPNADTASFEEAVHVGSSGLYAGVTMFNYSPVWAVFLHGLMRLSLALGLPFHTSLGAVFLMFDALTAILLWRLGGSLAAVLFAWNPVSILSSSFHFQFDTIAIFFLLGAIAVRSGAFGRSTAAALLSLSLLFKHVTWFHPLLFGFGRRRDHVASRLAVLAPYLMFAASFLPYYRFWTGIRRQILEYRAIREDYGLWAFFPSLSTTAATLLFVAAALLAAWRFRPLPISRSCLLVFLVILIFLPGVVQYYFVWPIALGALCGGGVGFFVYSSVVTLFMLGSPDGLNWQAHFSHLPDWTGPWWAAVFWLAWEIRRLQMSGQWAARSMARRREDLSARRPDRTLAPDPASPAPA